MKSKLVTLIASLGLLGGLPSWAADIEVSRAENIAQRDASPTQFTGPVKVRPLTTESSARFAGAGEVSFTAGTRTAWHTHPMGQWLYITGGAGWVKQETKAREDIRAGDVVWIPAGIKHWQGATQTEAMSHIAITPVHDGENVEWMDPVSDSDYLAEG